MTTLRTSIFCLVTAAFFGAATSPAAAQGCPWCTTPTTCSLVDESASFSCTVTSEGGCEDQGFCIIIETKDQSTPDAEAAAFSRLAEGGTRTIETDMWGTVEFARVREGLYGLWSCNGDLVALAQVDDDEITHLKLEPFREELHILTLAATVKRGP